MSANGIPPRTAGDRDARDYQPISCVQHERLEYAALKKQWLELTVAGDSQRLLPLDVYTRDGAEWLQARTEAGEVVTLRLDTLAF